MCSPDWDHCNLSTCPLLSLTFLNNAALPTFIHTTVWLFLRVLVSVHGSCELRLWFCPHLFRKQREWVTLKLAKTFDKLWIMLVWWTAAGRYIWLSLFSHQWIPSRVIICASSFRWFSCESECQPCLLVDRAGGIPAPFSWKLFPGLLNLIYWSRMDSAKQFEAVFLLQIKASTSLLGPLE